MYCKRFKIHNPRGPDVTMSIAIDPHASCMYFYSPHEMRGRKHLYVAKGYSYTILEAQM